MCPLCISAAAVAAMAGAGSTGSLATLVAVKLRLKSRPEKERLGRRAVPNFNLQLPKAGGGK